MTIKPQGLFHTPKSFEEIHDWIDKHPAEMRASLYTAAGMTWNLLAATINEGGSSDEQSATPNVG